MVQGFWDVAWHQWAHVSIVIVEQTVLVYAEGSLLGMGELEFPMPRMLRHENAIGSSLVEDHLHFFLSRFAVADVRIYDRSLSSMEVAALYAEPTSQCCVSAGMCGPFDVDAIDLDSQIMAAMAEPASTF